MKLKEKSFYGKKVSDMNPTEMMLLNIDLMLAISLDLQHNKKTKEVDGLILGTEEVGKFLCTTNIVVLETLLNISDETLDVFEIVEKTRYSFQKFLINLKMMELSFICEMSKDFEKDFRENFDINISLN